MSYVFEVFHEMWRILLDSSAYILLGIVAAGLAKIFINQEFVHKHLGNSKYLSVIKASLFGVPLPL